VRLEFWFDFSCPYAYLASRRIEEIARAHGAELALCPMLLGGVFRAIGAGDGPMATLGPAKARNNVLDMARWAERMHAPFTLPAGHPMRTVRALRIFLGLPAAAWPAAMHAIYAAYWQRGEDVTRDAVIAGALAAAGIDAAAIAAAITGAETAAIKEDLRARTDRAVARGVFGAPACIVDREDGTTPVLLWGQDRLGFLEAVLDGWQLDAAPPPGARRAVEVPPRVGPARAPGRVIDFWFDFSSPFAYLGSTQIEAIAAAAGAELRWRPLLLGALFRDIGTPDVPLFAMPAAKRTYVGLDMMRWSRWWDVAFRWPSRFPQKSVTALRLVQVAGLPPALIHRLFRVMWVDDASLEDEAVLARACADAGVDPSLIEATRAPAAKEALKASTDAARAAGVFGVPAMIVHGAGPEPAVFWGQDRLELVARLAATGQLA
jgi:2-hydroxychromene-2-carboxylate isomerase